MYQLCQTCVTVSALSIQRLVCKHRDNIKHQRLQKYRPTRLLTWHEERPPQSRAQLTFCVRNCLLFIQSCCTVFHSVDVVELLVFVLCKRTVYSMERSWKTPIVRSYTCSLVLTLIFLFDFLSLERCMVCVVVFLFCCLLLFDRVVWVFVIWVFLSCVCSLSIRLRKSLVRRYGNTTRKKYSTAALIWYRACSSAVDRKAKAIIPSPWRQSPIPAKITRKAAVTPSQKISPLTLHCLPALPSAQELWWWV